MTYPGLRANRYGVLPGKTSFYAEYRLRYGVGGLLRDWRDSPPENLLQAIWQHQRLLRNKLKTLDNRRVRVLHPGFRSREGGPDFRGALIEFGQEGSRSGDVEVDVRVSGWRGHGHDKNPAFSKVILQVVWDGEKTSAGGPPVLALREVLDASVGELSLWLGGEEEFPVELQGRCCRCLQRLTPEKRSELLEQAGCVRLRCKGSQFEARAKQAGWEQALWEGLFRGLGYRHNVWPMQRLAELRPVWGRGSALEIEARVFGLSGLLPQELTPARGRSVGYVRRVWDSWWRERDAHQEHILPACAWRRHGVRPANYPERRLALAANWSARENFARELENWCSTSVPDSHLAGVLAKVLHADQHEFWDRHWSFSSKPFDGRQSLLGASRVIDLGINVVLPWAWAKAVQEADQAAVSRIEHRYKVWPAAQDNSVLRLARHRLLGSNEALPGAAAQQGLIQMVRDFCDRSNAVCDGCKLPDLVAESSAESGGLASK